MATQNLANYDAILKNAYRGTIAELLNNEVFMLEKLEKTNVDNIGKFTGRQLIFAVHTGRNRGRNAPSDTAAGTNLALAVAGRQVYQDAIVPMHQYSEGIELTQMVIDQSQTDEGAFGRATEQEMNRATTDMRKDLNRMVYGTGDGLLATITGTPGAGTSITVDSGQFIAPGDTVDIVLKSTGVTTNGVVGSVVQSVTYTGAAASATQANATIVLGTATAGATSNLYGVYISSNRANESDGLRNITNVQRVLHGIDSNSVTQWDGNVIDALQTNPTEDLLMQLAQRIRMKTGQSIETFVGTWGVQRRLANQYSSQKRWNDDNAAKIAAGYSSIMISAGDRALPVVADVDCPCGFIFAINTQSFAWSQVKPPDWLSAPDGNSIFVLKDSANAAAGGKLAVWQAWFYWPAVLVCQNPRKNGQLRNVNDDIPLIRE